MSPFFELSGNQRDLWLDQQFYGSTVPYHIAGYIAFRGPLDIAKLRRALAITVAQVDALQLVFAFDGQHPRQRPIAGVEPALDLHDFSAQDDPAQRAHDTMMEDQARPFEPDHPPVRFSLYRLEPEIHYWYFVFHHLIADGWGWYRVMAQLIANYNRCCAGEAPVAAPPAFLASLAVEAKYRRSTRYERDRAFWRKTLMALPEPVDLPEVRDLQAARHHRDLDRAHWDRLAVMARAQGATPFQALVAIYGVYLARAFRCRALTLGLPVLNRTSAIAKRTPGLFTSEKPLALRLPAGTTFAELLGCIAADLRRSYRHQAFPLGALSGADAPSRNLFQFSLSYQRHRYDEHPVQASHAVHQLPPVAQREPLTLHVRDFDETGSLRLEFDYQREAFPAGFIADLGEGMLHLLDRFLEDPGQAVDAPALLPLDELAARERAWNRDIRLADPLHPVTHFRQVARTQPDKPVLWQEGRTRSYRALDRDSDAIARRLIDHLAAGPEVPIGLLCLRGYPQIAGIMGIFKAGAVLLPLDPDHPPERRRRLLAAAGCRLLLVDDAHGEERLPGVHSVPVDSLWAPLAALVQPPPTVDLVHTAYLLFTSGSTGEPKCCRISLANLGNYLRWGLRLVREHGGAFNDILHGSLTFDARLGSVILSLMGGGTLTAPPAELDNIAALRWVCEHPNPADVLDLTPSHLEVLAGLDLTNPRITRIFSTGEALTPAILEDALARFPGVRLINQYGPTEATIGCSAEAFGSGETIHLGQPVDGTRLYVLDPLLRPVPKGVAGELVIGGAGVCRGYDHRPKRTATSFVPDPFEADPLGARMYRSGDLVRRFPDGTLEFLGRIDHQLKINGQRIEPEEIEDVLRRHPDLDTAAVLPVQRGREKRLCAFYVSDRPVTAERLRAHVRRLLPPVMTPAHYVPLPALPLTTSGKTNRIQLASMLADLDLDPAATSNEAPTPPRTALESHLLRLCRGVLGVNRIGMDDNFVDLGGQSLTAVRLAARVRIELGRDLRVRDILLSPDLAALAQILAQKDRARARPEAPVAQGHRFPLTTGQNHLWFHQKLHPDSCTYHMPGTLDLRGPLDLAALSQAIERLQDRHEALRIRIEEREGRAFQHITDRVTPVTLHDLTRATDPEAEAHTRAERAAMAPFDLETEAPFRADLFHLAENHHLLLVVFHHIVCDGRSIEIFFRELSHLYAAARRGQEETLAPAPRWREQPIHDPHGETVARIDIGIDYWRRRLADLSRPPLPADRPASPNPDFRGDHVHFRLEATTVEALGLLAYEARGGPFAAIATLMKMLLFRATRHREVTIGTPYIGRDHAFAADAIGFFVTTLVLRSTVRDDVSFREMLAAEANAIAEALEHPPPPLERLAEELGALPEPGRTPFFDVLVAFEPNPQHDLHLPDLDCRLQPVLAPVAKLDLSFVATPDPQTGELVFTLTYRVGRFDSDRIERMARDVQNLARAAVTHPDAPLRELNLSAPESGISSAGKEPDARNDECRDSPERNPAPAQAFANGGPSHGDGRTVVDLLEATAVAHPDAVAVIDGEAHLDYRSLDRLANGLAQALVERLGVLPEDRIGLMCERNQAQAIGSLGILKAGAAYVPLDPDYPTERLSFMARDAGLRAIVAGANLFDRASDLVDRPIIRLESISACATLPVIPRDPNMAAFLIYTSGTTGRPKAAIQTHRGFANVLLARVHHLRLDRHSVYPQFFSISFDAAQLTLFSPLLAGGASLCVPAADREDPHRFAALLQRHGATHLFVPPAYLTLLKAHDIPSLEVLGSGGEAPNPALVAHFARRYKFHNDYGPCECSVMVTTHSVRPNEDLTQGVPLGRPLSGTRIYSLDHRLRAVPVGVEGEICIGGVPPGRGYHQRPAQTAASWLPDPFADEPGARMYRSGDFGRWDREGLLHFVGRRDAQVKIRGNRVEVGEVRRRLGEQPGVEAAVVVARATPSGNKELIAYYTTPDGAEIPRLKVSLAAILPDYMVPAYLVPLAAMPLTANGKIDTAALPAPVRSTRAAHQPPRDRLESVLAEIWATVLHHEPIGRESDFFELGGQSLSAMRVAALAREKLGCHLEMRDIFERPVLADLVDRLRRRTPIETQAAIPAIASAADYPLSHAQQRLWVLDRMADAAITYNMPGAFTLEGQLDADALEAGLQTLFARHEALRTVIAVRDGQPRQRLLPPDRFSMTRLDLSHREDAEAQAMALARRDATTAFDLAAGPLMRAALVKLADQRHLLFVCLHHIVCDGWSLRIMTRELFRFYREPRDGAPLAIHYKDYAAWQNDRLEKGFLDESRRFWLARFDSPPAALDLPTDQPRSATPRFDGARVPLKFDPALTRQLRTYARDHQASSFILLQALVKVLLFRHTGQTDLVIGVPVAGRDHADLDGQVGFYVNMLALRDRLEPGSDFSHLLISARDNAAEAYAHQAYPFDLLVAELPGERDPGRAPLFDVVVSFEDPRETALELPGLRVLQRETEVPAGKFDLTFAFEDAGTHFTGAIEYNCRLFDAGRIRSFAAQLTALAEAVVAGNDASLALLPVHAPGELARLRAAAQGERLALPPEAHVVRYIERQVTATPNRTAVVAHDGNLSYADLKARANRLTHALQSRGVGPERRVGVMVARGRDLPVALLAVLQSGAAYVPLDPTATEPHLRRLWREADCHVLLHEPDQTEKARRIAGPAALCLSQAQAFPDYPPHVAWHPQQAAYVIFTSGSTGRPKGVVVAHAALVNLLENYRHRFFGSLSQHPVLRVSSFSATIFDASVPMIFAPLAFGHEVHIAREEELADARLASAFLKRNRVHMVDGTPGMLAAILEYGGWNPELALVISGGEALPASLARRFAEGPRLANAYGPTESCVDAVGCRIAPSDANRDGPLPIGEPYANLEAFLMDRFGRLVPEGAAGELWLGGAGLARGYLNQPAATAESFVPHPFRAGARLYRTGDLACCRTDGRLVFLGRRDAQVKLRGFRIELGEVEEALRRLPGVAVAAAKLHEDGAGDCCLAAYLVPTGDGADLDLDHPAEVQVLRDLLAARLPRYMLPSVFVSLPALPLTATGKLNREALPTPERTAIDIVPPRNDLERSLVAIWRDVLECEVIGIHDDFFRLGGHSLKAIRLSARVHADLGLELGLNEILGTPTIAQQARLLQTRNVAAVAEVARLPQAEHYPVSHAQRRMWILDRLDPVAYNMPGAFSLEGPLDRSALERAFVTVIARHESLRTTFCEVDGEPRQRIQPTLKMPLPLIDLSQDADPRARAADITRQEAHRPFDLTTGPLIRLSLLRLAPQHHLLLANMHHIVCDEWSMGVLVRELGAAYRAHKEGSEPRLPTLTRQYRDFTAHALSSLDTSAQNKHRDYWLKRLAGDLPVLELPADRPRPPRQAFVGSHHRLLWEPELADALATLARRRGNTLYMVLAALAAIMLKRHTGQDHVLVGMPVSGRDRLDLENQVGLYLNTLVLRSHVQGETRLEALLDQVARDIEAAFSHRDYPFDRLVDELGAARDLSRSPVFQAMIVMQEREAERFGFEGLRTTPFPLAFDIAKCDLTFFFQQCEDGLLVTLEYAEHLGHARMRRFAEQFRHLAQAAPRALDLPVDRLPLLPPPQRRALLAACDRRREREDPCDVLGVFADQVSRNASETAVVFGDRQLSYGRLDALSRDLAALLRQHGIGPEDVVGVALPRGEWVPVALLAILRAGGVYLPLDPTYPRERLAHTVRHSRCKLLLALERPARSPVDLAVLSPIDPPPSDDAATPALAPDRLAYLIYTSGSTGVPKGVACTHRCLNHLVAWQRRELGSGLRVAAYAPLGFDVSIQEMLFTLCGGGCLYVVSEDRRRDLAGLTSLLLKHHIQMITMPFSALDLLFGDEDLDVTFPALRFLCTSGEALRRTAGLTGFLSRHPEVVLHNQYGPSETHVVTACDITVEDPEAAPIGRPIDGSAAYLLDAHLQPVPAGVVGEIYLAGANLARGYHGDPGQTAARFLPDPFGGPGDRIYRSGDLGRLEEDGRISFLGRNDRQVKIRGYRVEPDEVSQILRSLPGVREAATVGLRIGDTTELASYVVGPQPKAAEAIRQALSDRLPAFMMPAFLEFLPSLPRLPSGKLDPGALPRPVRSPSRPRSERPGRLPRDPLERQLAAHWSRILGRDEMSIDDDFFALGGHSLKAMQLVAALRKDLRQEVALVDLFEAPTVAAFAQRLRQGRPARYLPYTAVPDREHYPLSPAQRRIWLLARLDPGCTAYHVPVLLRLKGYLDEGALAAALTEVVARHHILRTRFLADGDEPVQRIDPPTPPPIRKHDLRHAPAQALSLQAQHAEEPFDLARAHPFRIDLVREDANRWSLLLCFHHIATDGWSMTPLLEELTACYSAHRAGRRPDLPPLPVQYRDYAVRQDQLLRSGELEAQVRYWRAQLADADPPRLPCDHARPEVFSYRGASHLFDLDEADSAAVQRLAQAEGVTPYVVLLGAFHLSLARYCGGRAPHIGTPVANRDREELAGLIGFFVNTLVIRAEFDPAEPVRLFLHRLRCVVLEAFDHRDVPFEALVEMLQPERDRSRQPLFDVMFAFQGPVVSEGRWPDLAWESASLPHETAKFDLTLTLVETDGRLHGCLEYCSDLFTAETMARLAHHYVTMLRAMTADPLITPARMPMITEDERQRLVALAGTPEPLPSPCAGIHQMFERQAARHPDRIALSLDGARMTYGQLEARANRLAHHLRRLRVGPETLVALMLEPSFETLVGILAVLKAGGAYLPLDPRQPRPRLQAMMGDARPVLLLHHGLERSDLPEGDWPTLDLADEIIWAPLPDSPPSPALSPDHLAYVIYTSGSSGAPKGVMVAHRQVLQLFAAAERRFDFDERDVWTLFHAYSFDFSVWEIWGALAYGGRLVIVPYWLGRTPARFLELLRTERVTVLSQTPSAFGQLLAAEARAPLPDADVPRYVVFGGEALEVSTVHAWMARHPEGRTRFVNMYGITETCVHVTFRELDAGSERGDVGRALPHLAAYVCDAALRLQPPGLPGELMIAGEGVARGYLNRPGLTAERFQPNPFATRPGQRLYRSGDLAVLRPNGALIHRGRADQQVKIRGYRIEPGEIRAALAAHPLLADAAVVARGSGAGPILVAYVQAHDASAELVPDPREWLTSRLPTYMVPSHFVRLKQLPLTPNGKLDRRRLPEPETRAEAPFAPPRNETERRVARMWEAVLDTRPVGIHDDFFERGGHSLAAARVTNRIHAELGVEIALRDFFATPTVAFLTDRIASLCRSTPETNEMLGVPLPSPVAETHVEVPVSHAQRRMWFLSQIEGQSIAYNMPHALAIDGALNEAAMVSALEALVARHQGLRCVLRYEEGRLHQRVLPESRFTLSKPELAPCEETGDWFDEVRAWCERDAHRPFSLASEPPFRAALFSESERHHVLYLNLHHAAGDGWSIGLIVRELAAFYRFHDAGIRHGLDDTPMQITTFSVWQAALLESARIQAQRSFWLARLTPPPSRLELPLDHPRPAVRSYRGDRRQTVFPPETATRLERLAHGHGASLFILLLAAIKALLYRYSGQSDFVIGTPVAARPHPRLEGLVGCLVNTLPLRDAFHGQMSFAALLQQTAAATLDMLDHQLYPFERLVDDLALVRDTSRPVLFDVMLVMQNAELDLPDLGGPTVTGFPFAFRTAKFDMLFNFWQADEGLHLELEFNGDLFEAHRIERMFGHLETLLDAVIHQPDQKLDLLPIMPAVERSRLLRLGRQDPPVDPRPTLLQAFARRVAAHPERTALDVGGMRWTYAQVDGWSAALAAALRAEGVGVGDRVITCLPREAPVAVCLLAVLRLGATHAYLDPHDPALRKRQFLAETQPSAVLARPADRDVFGDLPCLAVSDEPPPDPVSFLDVVPAPHLPAYLIYTSGSTGKPKAVVGTHACLENLMAWQLSVMGPNLRGLGFAALGFDVAVQEMLFTLYSGGTLYALSTLERLDMAGIADCIERHQIQLMTMPYTPLSLFFRENRNVPDCLRHIVTSGERLRLDTRLRDTLQANPNLVLHNQYGPSETHVVTAQSMRGSDPSLPDLPAIGTPIADTRCLVLDGHGQPVPTGVAGELYLGGANLANGYLGRAALTAQAFVPAPPEAGLEAGARLYRTGDRCVWDEAGLLHFQGRFDDQVKVRGFRVEPGEVAAVLADHAAVQEAAVVAHAGDGRTRLAAYVITSQATEADALGLWLRERLPEHMVPEAFLFLDAFPLNANGKLDRAALPMPARPQAPKTTTQPATGAERTVADIWKAVLELDSVGVHDAFFDIGGNSFSLIEIHGRLKAEFGEPLPIVKLFEHTTIAALAAYLSGRDKAKSARVAARAEARKAARGGRRRR
ncbi:Non-ribosomal peptide synthase/polyketide synthase [Sulfidibacter corallicola]|uniref:Non-ribosomal peptide synthase/polyketide synthase n=1 Tax=Sulfidibacter corallicola TaxID=2818388 RepID=A0A8A4U0J0_SULCO|nr:non-ribosomal peptide synthase/polyketide synthase [Sulfidibacter corallicola]QTD52265.1 non-ribosomal peptide synthase/polyketide synthase [Sulfidibacter corallicola]